MRISTPYNKRKARIEIVPLIDIIFFLLATFVMVSLSMVKNEGVPINLPAAATATPQARDNSVTVSVTKAGDIYLGKEKVDMETLLARLSELKAREQDPKVFIHGDEETAFRNMMKVLDGIKSTGIMKVAMQTRREPASGVSQ